MNAHDLGYNKLFSHARMIQDLVAGFIQEGWVSGLDFSTPEKVGDLCGFECSLYERDHPATWRLSERLGALNV